MATTRARRRLSWFLLAAVAWVAVEVLVVVQVGQAVGGWWTILLLVLGSLLGGWVVRREGARAWRALTAALESGRMPAEELTDGVLVLVGGALVLLPGFVSDVVGILVILPLTRPVFRRMLSGVVGTRLTVAGPVDGSRLGDGRLGPDARHPGPVVRGEVVDD
ncbi:FxsA family protein [Nocardioides sp. C4-1]|uniref:FxsA family protein n=1 Tax=Nocardioides sp. C4-1 TaxID=3151851 RepID=UPI0032672E51